jgi:soluble lytic murein transglycosylase-like protein
VRQESRFNADATSHAGARGLMQLMPRTAAYIAKDSGVRHDSEALRDPGINLKLGQDYFKYLTSNLSPQGDLLRAVAAYNGGPGAVMRAVETVGSDYDPLMLIESLPAAETRDYVEKVVSGYWIYRRIFGEDSKTLDAVASGARSAELKLDR